jgi:hypothetical protein
MISLIILLVLSNNPATVEVYSTDLNGASRIEAVIPNPNRSFRTPPQQMPGWPKNMGVHPNYRPSGVIFADVTGDGYLEILAGSTDGTFHVWNYQGNELPGWPKTSLEPIQAKAAVGDLDPVFPGLEIVVAGRTNTLYAWHNDGTNVTGWPQSVGETGGFKSPVLFDLDGNSNLSVILGQRYWPDGRMLIFNSDGTPYPGWPQSLDYMCVATPSIGDVNGDSVMEICALSYYSVYLWDKDGNLMPGWPKLNVAGGMSYAQPVLADLDDDNDFEILHSYYTSGQNYVGIYHHDATNFSGWPDTFPGPQTYTTPVTGDIDDDEDLEIFGGGHVFGGINLLARHHTGAVVSGWPVVVEMLECSPIVFDLDDDGDREVLIGDNLNPGNFYAFHGNGSIVADWPVATTAAAIVNSATVGDVDSDGDIEIALVVSDGTVNLWTLDSIQYRGYLTDWGTFFHDTWNTGWLHPKPPQNLNTTSYSTYIELNWYANAEPDIAGYNIYRAQVSGGPYPKINTTVVTDTTYHDSTALPGINYFYCVTAQIKAFAESRLSNEASGYIGISERESESLSTISMSPNPFLLSINFNTDLNNCINVRIYDVEGALVDEVKGTRSIEWKPKQSISSGIYFAEIITGKKTIFKKLIKLK